MSRKDYQHRSKISRINNFLSNPKKYNRDQHTIFPREFIDDIHYEFVDVNRNNKRFDHKFSSKQLSQVNQSLDVNMITRIIKLRFRCKNQKCTQYLRDDEDEKEEAQNRWTSYYGQVELQYYFIQRTVNKKPQYILQYSFKMYKQKCKTCHEWGKGGIIQSMSNKLLQLYRQIIMKSLHQLKTKKKISLQFFQKYGRPPIQSMKQIDRYNHTTGHLQSLCEACKQKKCIGFYIQPKETSNDQVDQVQQW